jgi:hypothetical protein
MGIGIETGQFDAKAACSFVARELAGGNVAGRAGG